MWLYTERSGVDMRTEVFLWLYIERSGVDGTEVTAETQQLRACLAALTTAASRELGVQAPLEFPVLLRRQLFELLLGWCTDGSSQSPRPGDSSRPAKTKVMTPKCSRRELFKICAKRK